MKFKYDDEAFVKEKDFPKLGPIQVHEWSLFERDGKCMARLHPYGKPEKTIFEGEIGEPRAIYEGLKRWVNE